MPAYKKCDRCGAHNDPGERCDCEIQNNVVVKVSDDNELTTRINGTIDSTHTL